MFPQNIIGGSVGREFETHGAQRFPLGTQMVMQDGRKFRYAKAGASALVVGNLLQGPALVSNHVGITATAAAAVGDRTVSATLGATAATKDQYADGYLLVQSAAGGMIPIAGHDAVASAGVITVKLKTGLRIAVATTANNIDLVTNPFSGVIQNPTTQTGAPVGVAVSAIAAAGFGWVQTAGPAAVLTDGTVVLGDSVMPSNGTAGAVEAWNLTEGTPNVEIAAAIGRVIRLGATGEQSVVWLTLDN